MPRYYRPPRRSMAAVPPRSLVAFLLVASFGILFAGCGGKPPADEEEFAFTAEDLARFRDLARQADMGESGTTVLDLASGATVELTAGGRLPPQPPGLGLSLLQT